MPPPCKTNRQLLVFLSRFFGKQSIHAHYTNQRHELTRNVVSVTSCGFTSCEFVDRVWSQVWLRPEPPYEVKGGVGIKI
jgi:hypothetical protein